jgi:hypothetical protein
LIKKTGCTKQRTQKGKRKKQRRSSAWEEEEEKKEKNKKLQGFLKLVVVGRWRIHPVKVISFSILFFFVFFFYSYHTGLDS